MASAFISYAHEDQELVLDLVEHLRGQGLDIRYDQVVLLIGDSLIEKISREIANSRQTLRGETQRPSAPLKR